MESVFDRKADCCGCTACASVCPQTAIHMAPDACGFLYPTIDPGLCIDCGLCRAVCSFSKPNGYERFQECHVVTHHSQEIVNDSRSGGFFTALSDTILDLDGVVYGAMLDETMFVRHVRAVNRDTRNALRKSKYVQSNLDGIFSQAADDLKAGKYVLFTGTGCQCDGLRGYLHAKHVPDEKLVLCDLVCHGASSPELFQKYMAYQEKRFGSRIKEFYFREKEKYSWASHVEKLVFENNRVFYTDEYANLFYSDDVRPSCNRCKYTSLHRSTDLTMADAWGAEVRYPDILKTGASLVLVNTSKGAEFFGKASKDLLVRDIPIEEVMQPRLMEPEPVSPTYDGFWTDYQTLCFADFMKKYGVNTYSLPGRLRRRAAWLAKLPKRAAKKMIRGVQRYVRGE